MALPSVDAVAWYVFASASAAFVLPEISRADSPLAGVSPRLIRAAGTQRAAETALMGQVVSAQESIGRGIHNAIGPRQENLIEKSLVSPRLIVRDIISSAVIAT